jgi:4-hydroxy-tetrahydrodipicolinate reductase
LIRIGISGAAGRMGQSLIAACTAAAEVQVRAALERGGSAAIGRDAGELAGLERLGISVVSDLHAIAGGIDVLVEFTSPAATIEHLRTCRERSLRMVIGTTGLDAAQQAEISEAAGEIAIVQSPNMSVGVNLCFRLVELASAVMAQEGEIGIREVHHAQKKDAPSGTALRLGEIVARVLGIELGSCAVYAPREAPRGRKSIRFESIREGEIVGDHTVSFATSEERVEITHRAFTRRAFAEGAVRAAKWIATKQRGLYDMLDVLELR